MNHQVPLRRIWTLTLVLALTAPVWAQSIGELEFVADDADYRLSHKVLPNETLYGIANEHGLSLEQLLELNGMSENETIYPGQRLLVVPPGAQPATPGNASLRTGGDAWATPDPTAAATYRMQATTEVERRRYYQVQEGETIESVAHKFRVNPEYLRDWNATSQVYPGQTLIVDKWTETVDMASLRGRDAAANLRVDPGANQRTRSDAPAALDQAQRVGHLSDLSNSPFGNNVRIADPGQQRGNGYARDQETQAYQTSSGWLMERPSAELTRSEYQRVRSGNAAGPRLLDEIEVSGPYQVMEARYRDADQPFYAYHNEVQVGEKIQVQIPNNSGFIEVEVIGAMPRGARGMIVVSPAVARIIEGAGEHDHRVTIRY